MKDQLARFNPEATALGMMVVGWQPAHRPAIPENAKPLWHMLSNAMVDGVPGIARAIKARSDEELDHLAVDLSLWAWEASYIAPPPTGANLVVMIFDLCQNELARRRTPKPPALKHGDWIAATKAANRVEDLAARFTPLRPAGAARLKGCCPMHQEKTPSFYIWTDHQKWRCFGACTCGGDVLDLAQRLGVRL